MIRGIAPLLRASRNLHRVLQTARDEIPEDTQIINFRDRAYKIERTAELLYGDAKNALDFAVAQQAEKQADASHRMAVASHRLNVLAAFFFPMATISAVFGMNLLHGMEDYPPPATFLVVLGLGLLSGFVLKWFITRESPRG